MQRPVTTRLVVALCAITFLAGCGQEGDRDPSPLGAEDHASLAKLVPTNVEFTTNYPRPVVLDPLHTAGDEKLAASYEDFACTPITHSAQDASLVIQASTLLVSIGPSGANTEPRWRCVVTKNGQPYSFVISGHVTDGTFH